MDQLKRSVLHVVVQIFEQYNLTHVNAMQDILNQTLQFVALVIIHV